MTRGAPATLKTAVAIRHIHFKDLGNFEAVLTSAGYRIHYYDLGVHELWTLDPLLPDLLAVLGGPVGVYDTDAYPFLADDGAVCRVRVRNRAQRTWHLPARAQPDRRFSV